MRISKDASFYSDWLINLCCVLILCIGGQSNVLGQITINEVCSSNGNVLEDQSGSTPDWIELYNSSNSDVALNGWHLSDDIDQPNAWAFSDEFVPANGYRIVFCSGTSQHSTEPHASFKLSKSGETVVLSNSSGIIEDSITVGYIPTNYTFGRQTDGQNGFVYYSVPTPRLTNNSSQGTESYLTAQPTFNIPSGYHNSQLSVSISCTTADSWIHYTTDGSLPDQSSAQYNSPILVDSTTVVRAIAYSPEFFASNIGYASYILDDRPDMPTISITTDPGNLFHEDTGIYVFGNDASPDFPFLGANFWDDVEVPVHIHFIEDDGTHIFDQDIGMEIHGGSVSRTNPMRSLRFLAKSSYGKNRIRHEVFPSKGINDHKRILLRNSGSDFLKLGYRDGFIHEHLLTHKVDIDLGAYRPARVYINGDYWGLYNLREKIDRYYVEDNHNADDKNIDLLEEQDIVLEGSFDDFNMMEQYILSQDLSDQGKMDVASSYFDTKNLVDYFACQTILNNADWPWNNLKYWRERAEGAKWRYMLFDLDVVLGGVNFIPADFNNLSRVMGEYGDGNRHVDILENFLENEEFKRYFINRYNDLLNSVFLPSELSHSIEVANEKVVSELPRHWERWDGEPQWYNDAFDTALVHINSRPQHARNDLKKVFSLGEESTITLSVFPAGSGTIDINTLQLSKFPWNGQYHDGNEIDVTANPNNGSVFSHWEMKDLEVSTKESESIRFNPENNVELVAVFDATFLGIGLTAYPEPASTEITTSFEIPVAGNMTIILSDMQGRSSSQLFNGVTLPGPYSATHQLPRLEQGIYLLTVTGDGYQASIKIPVIQN